MKRFQEIKFFCYTSNTNGKDWHLRNESIFRSARTSCTTFDWSRPSALKIWITYIQAKTHQTNPMAPWHPLDALLTPLGPPGTPWQPPNRPPQTHKQVSWPHCTLKITSTASEITFTFNPVTDVAPSTLSPPSPPSP